MAKALRRGIAHYAEGDEDTAKPPPDTSLQGRRTAVNAANAPVPVPGPGPVAPSGLGQLLSGVGSALNPWAAPDAADTQFKAAAQNPTSSPVTSALGNFADYLSRSTRLDAVSRGPSLKDRLGYLFFGNQGDTTIQQQDQASQALRDPKVQQHLMTNPDQLAEAEQNRLAYAAKIPTPEFQKVMETAVAANADAAAHPKVTQDEHPKVVEAAVKNNVPVNAAHASVAPHKYTRDEFIAATDGMTSNNFRTMFGQQLGHVVLPQEKAANEFFDRLRGVHAAATQKVNDMIAEDAERVKNHQLAKHTVKPFWGPAPLDAAKAEQAAADKAIQDAISSFTGISTKGITVPRTN